MYVDGGRVLILAAIAGAWCTKAQTRAGYERVSIEGARRGTCKAKPFRFLGGDRMTRDRFRARRLLPALLLLGWWHGSVVAAR